jgi:hypothetical protein
MLRPERPLRWLRSVLTTARLVLTFLLFRRRSISRLACFHNAELDVSRFPDDVTFSDLQPRMLCTVCDHRGADVGPS